MLIAAVVILLIGTSCNEKEEPVNYEMLDNPNPVRILAIGNSFTDDPMIYIDDIVDESRINKQKICVYSVTRGGTSLQYWATVCQSEEILGLNYCAGKIRMDITKGTLKELLSQNWDIVTVQQLSALSRDPNSLDPWLPYLIEQIRTNCTNKNVKIAFQQIWSYWSREFGLEKTIADWKDINKVVRKLKEYDIDLIIPSGTAIQNARNTILNTSQGLTRDGMHLDNTGRYVASCTWFEALIAPYFNTGIIDIYYDEALSDSKKKRILCHQCAAEAVKNPFDLYIP